jgi:hypothetical protein
MKDHADVEHHLDPDLIKSVEAMLTVGFWRLGHRTGKMDLS